MNNRSGMTTFNEYRFPESPHHIPRDDNFILEDYKESPKRIGPEPTTKISNNVIGYLNGNEKKSLRDLKNLIGASLDVALKDKSCLTDDEFLVRFLYARKHIVPDAFELLVNYHAYRQKNRDYLQNLTIKDQYIQMALQDGFPGVLKERDRRGRRVLVFFASNWEPAQYSFLIIYKAMLLTLENLLDDIQNQANGFIAIVDWTNFTFKQSTQLNPKILRIIIEGLQDCFPVRFKAIHFVNQPWYVETALSVIRPFLKEKTRKRFILHGSNLSTLHETVAKDILPTELGGEAPSFNPLIWYNQLIEKHQIANKLKPNYEQICASSRKTYKFGY